MGNGDLIIVPRQITEGTSFGKYSNVSDEARKSKYHGANTTGSGESNINPVNGKIRDKFVLKDYNMNCVLYDGYSDESYSYIIINNRRGESVRYYGEQETSGSYDRRMTRIDVQYLKPDGTFGFQEAIDKNNNGVVDKGEIIDFKW